MDYADYYTPAGESAQGAETMAAPPDGYTLAAAGEPVPCMDVYVVEAGDTYYGIAGKLGITVYEMSSLNPYVDPDALRIGQQLCIPALTREAPLREPQELGMEPAREREEEVPTAPTPTALAQAAPSPVYPPNCAQLTIPQGWDLPNILMRYGISYRALQSCNPGMDMGALRPGETLCIPPAGTRGAIGSTTAPSHTIERQETLETIARRYRTSVARLFEENPVLAPDDFIAGRLIAIPEA